MSELTNIHARAVKDLTTPTELPADPNALDQVKLVAGNFPTEYAGNEALTFKQIKELATPDLERKVNASLSNLSTTANKFYPTLSEANNHLATMSVNDVVTIGEEANKGLWYKATAGATTLTKSAYDPLTQANNYTNNKASTTKTEAVAIANNYTDLVFDTVPAVIAPYVAQAEAAATAATISAGVFETPEAGVDPTTGVEDGDYFNVRSPSSDSYIDEYQNIDGVATPSGKTYPSGAYVQNIVKYTALPFVEGKTYSLNERVQLTNGDIVKSTIDGNTNNPNVDMTGWLNPLNIRMRTVKSFSDLLTTSPKYDGEVVLLLSHTAGEYKGGGQFKYDSSKVGQDDGGTVANGWVRVDLTLPQPEWFGAMGDNVKDDTLEIRKAAAVGNRLHLVGDYIVTDTIVFDRAHFFSVTGLDKNSIIRNRCVGKPCFKFVTKEYTEVRNLKIWGNGGAFGVGATVGEAIVYENAPHFNIVNCNIRYNGAGIKCIGGVWCVGLTDVEIEHNLGRGFESISNSGIASEQTGNALNIKGGSISLNGGDGVRWKASSICVTGTTIEANKGKGFVVDNTGLTNSAFGIFFSGNYLENNVQGDLLFKSDTGVNITDVVILGNHFYSIQKGPTAFIKFEGPFRSNRNVYVGPNSCVFGGTVQNLVDGGNSLREDCYIQAGTYPCINLGYAKLTQGYKTKTLFGKSSCLGATWSAPDLSDNFHSATSKDIYFDIPLKSNDLLERLQFLITSNTTAQYTLGVYLMKKDPTTSSSATNLFSATLQSDVGGGNKLFTFSPLVSNYPVRLEQGFHYYVRITVSGMSTGTEAKISNPVIRYV